MVTTINSQEKAENMENQWVAIVRELGPGFASQAALHDAPVVAQGAALSGAIQWALHRGLAVRQIHGGGRGYFVPIYLVSREDLTCTPDLVAPVQVQSSRLIVRTLLEPHVAYSPARAVVERWELLPGWLLDAWDNATERGEDGASSGAEPDD